MGKLKNFAYRIKLNLKEFYSDHRQYCYTFVKENFNVVEDLINHIQETFQIYNFLLLAEKKKAFYISPTEDIRIIRPNNTICVIPKDKNTIQNENNYIIPQISDSIHNSNDNISNQSLKVKKKKAKTKKLVEDVENETNVYSGSNLQKKAKKSKVQEICKIFDTPCLDDNIHNNSKQNFKSKLDTENGDIHMKEPDNGENTKLKTSNMTQCKEECNNITNNIIGHYTPVRNILPSSTITKKINIIKNIIVNTNDKVTSNGECSVSVTNTTMQSMNSTIENGSNLNGEFPKENVSNLSPESIGSSIDGKFVTLRKRKRVRKRKPKIHQDSPMPQPIPKKTKPLELAKPLVHKYFDDIQEISDLSPQIQEVSQSIGNSENVSMNTTNDILSSTFNIAIQDVTNDDVFPSNNDTKNDSNNSIVSLPETTANYTSTATLNTTTNEQSRNSSSIGNVTTNAKDDSNSVIFCGKVINQEQIDKCELMTNISPTVNDVIIFKKLKLGENITPIVSNYIIGHVLKYSESSHEMQMHILFGIDEFIEPVGLFNISDGNERVEQPNSLQVLSWKTLIKPRLLQL